MKKRKHMSSWHHLILFLSITNILFLPVQLLTSEKIFNPIESSVHHGIFASISPIEPIIDAGKQQPSSSLPLLFTLLFFSIPFLIAYPLVQSLIRFSPSKRGQASMEYIILVGLILVVMIPLFAYSLYQSNSHVKINQADDAVQTLAKAADTIYALGPGAKKYVWVNIPQGVSGTSVQNNSVLLQISVFGGRSDLSAITNANLIGGFPSIPGSYKVPVEALDSGYVLIGEGNDTTPPIVTWKNPSGTICYQNVILEAYTNEPAHCRWESIDTDYDTMLNNFQGEMLTHTYALPILDEDSYTYYVRCMDPFTNKMSSSAVINFTVNVSICGSSGNESGIGCVGASDINPPNVIPVNPPDDYTSNMSRNYFYFNVTDESDISFCELLIDELPRKTEPVISKVATNSIWYDLNQGNYSWAINCTDACPNEGTFAPPRDIIVNATLDNDTPIITISLPANNSVLDYNLINFFYFTVDNTSGIKSCTLNVSGALDTGGNSTKYITDSTVQENISQYMTMALDMGNYTWQISCKDDSFYENEGFSQQWYFRVNKTFEAGIALSDLGVDNGWYFKTNGAGIFTKDSQMVSYISITNDLLDDDVNTPSTSYVIRTRNGAKYEGFIVKANQDSSGYIKVTLYGRVRIIDQSPFNLRVYGYIDDDTPNTNLGGYKDFAINDTILNQKVKWVELDVSELAAAQAGNGWMKFRVTDLEENNKRLQFSELHIRVG